MTDDAVALRGRPASRGGDGVAEVCGRIGGADGPYGVVASSDLAPRTGRAVVFLDAAAQRRAEPGRLWAPLSRRWARYGIVSMRLDPAGLGRTSPTADLDDAVTHLHEVWGARSVIAVGSGEVALHAFAAAAEGVSLESVCLVNAPRFTLDDGERRGPYRRPGRWLIDRATDRARELARWAGVPVESDVGEALARAARSTHLRFLFTEGEGGALLVEEMVGSVVRRLVRRGELSIRRLHGIDRSFSSIRAQRLLIGWLEGWVGLPRPALASRSPVG